MKRILILGLLLAGGISSHAQVVTIRDMESYQPLELVTLSSKTPEASAVTDARGQADISAFRGSEQIEIRMIGFTPQKRSFADLERSQFEVYLVQSNVSLDQVVITASRWNQPARDVPARITTISPKEIALQNPQTAADLLASSGEVYIQKSQQGGGSPMIRGFSTNRLLITVDGVRMNTAIFRSGNLQNVISLDAFATERAEVLFGPGSVIYGSDAIGGVMNFSTLTPQFSTGEEPVVKGSAVVRMASANREQTGHFDINVGWRKWSLLSSVTHTDYDDLRMGRFGPEEYLRHEYVQRLDTQDVVVANDDPLVQLPTGYSQLNMMQKVRFSPNERWDFTYGFHYSTTTDYARYDRLLRYRGGLPRSAEWYYGPQEWMMNNLQVVHRPEKGAYDEFTIRLAQQHFGESRIDRDFNALTRSIRIERVEAYSANFDFFKTIGTYQKVFYGLEGVFNDVTSIGRDEDIATGVRMSGPARYPQSTWSSYAAYATYQVKPTEQVTVQAGARYNQFMLDAEFDTTFYPFPFTSANLNADAITGSLGAVYNPGNWIFGVNLSTGFRAPNVDDIGKVFDSEPGSVVIPNPVLRPEYAYNAEVDIARVIGDFLKVDITGYYTILEDALVRRDFQLNGQDSIVYDGELSQVQAIQNAAGASVWGVQAMVEAKLPAGFGTSAHFNYQKGEEELDDGTVAPLRHAAPWFGIAHLTYTARRLKLDFYAVYNDEVSFKELAPEEQGKDYMYAIDNNGNPYAPAWYTLNFKAMYQVSDHLALSGGLENITDQRYRPYSSGLVAAGRNFILSARVLF